MGRGGGLGGGIVSIGRLRGVSQGAVWDPPFSYEEIRGGGAGIFLI